ncbi:hypothetical protein [Aureispira anguillae]|uniref:Uncharacterized protein n=1 Tax=Aureispira anguillae TaxID=2864201 RepID=A0A915YHF4_9BACT|nr:hypothetical protein [Aureispira anguillae]BDS13228.1 hypothetical protein AsAng_0039570 [Aureispira anguillae]
MEQIKKIIGLNLVILVAYTVLIQLIAQDGLKILVVTFYTVMAHTLINGILTTFFLFKDQDSPLSKAFFLSAVLIMLIGFSSCWGNVFISDLIR